MINRLPVEVQKTTKQIQNINDTHETKIPEEERNNTQLILIENQKC